MDKSKQVILIIDDDPVLLKLYEKLFGRFDVKLKIAEDGQAGFEAVKRQKPDFVILDIRMPKLDGIHVLEMMRKNPDLKDIPVMILTNYGLEEYKGRAEKLGIVDFLVKTNVDPMALVKRVVDYVSRSGAS